MLSVGVGEFELEDVEPIPAAMNDAAMIYTAVRRCCQDEFDNQRSFRLINPRRSAFLDALDLALKSLTPDDIFILFFSGHGAYLAGRLRLCMRDWSENTRAGGVTHIELSELLSDIPCQALVVLDCCCAGGGAPMARAVDAYSDPKVSFLASTTAYGVCTTDGDHSTFSQALSEAFGDIRERAEPLTVSALKKGAEQQGVSAVVNVAEGKGDLALCPPAPENALGLNSAEIVRLVLGSPSSSREMLWYQLSHLPSIVFLSSLEEFNKQEISEPSWLVRRAIGSVLGERRLPVDRDRLILECLTSPDWMRQALGLIAGRAHLGNDAFLRRFLETLHDPAARMDVRWLAFLYLADKSLVDIPEVLATPLAATPWGALEVYERFVRHKSLLEEPFMQALDERGLAESVRQVQVHRFLLGEDGTGISEEDLPNPEFYRYVYENAKPRGHIPTAKVKWLFSALRGDWRGAKRLEVAAYLESRDVDEGRRALSAAAQLPLVEMRMAVLQEVKAKAGTSGEYAESLVWAATDPHPWVRREAVWLGRHVDGLDFGPRVDSVVYPGQLDLLIEVGGLKQEAIAAEREALTKRERDSLDWFLQKE